MIKSSLVDAQPVDLLHHVTTGASPTEQTVRIPSPHRRDYVGRHRPASDRVPALVLLGLPAGGRR